MPPRCHRAEVKPMWRFRSHNRCAPAGISELLVIGASTFLGGRASYFALLLSWCLFLASGKER